MSPHDEDDCPLEIDFGQFLRSSTSEVELSPTTSTGDLSATLTISAGTTVEECGPDFDDLLEEAFKYYGSNRKPAFCVANKGETTRLVKLVADGEDVQLYFRSWLGGSWGYWVLVDRTGDKHICKSDIRGDYRIWQGILTKFCEEPVAQTSINDQNRKSSSIEDDILNHGQEEGEGHGHAQGPARSLRKRSTRQQKPYAMDRLQRKNELRGIQISESELESSLMLGRREESCIATLKEEALPGNPVVSIRKKPQTVSDAKLDDHKLDIKTNQESAANGLGHSQTILRSRLNRSTGPFVPVYMEGVGSSKQLFDELRHRWAFQLKEKTIQYCIIRFSWMDEDHSLLLLPCDDDGYRLLCDELRRAPPTRIGRIDLDLELRT